ncbi:magnesium transporter CorA [Rhodoferax koreense]|uniref:Magnesium transporter CorA n=1 Tax=Rhodoferax koreensis TaxID=1842727 RepID=A0A1P8JWW7_9BURK|nr:transporter [Rhodoferax koreense]APW38246.1 magnesium transporter CorA [Rhodoferax koreense]
MPAAHPLTNTYGSDQHGLICGFVFEPGRPGRPIALSDAATWLARPTAPGQEAAAGFVWLHFNLTDATAEKWMRGHLPLPEAYFDNLRDGTRSTRLENIDDNLVAVVNDVAYEFAFEPSEIASLWVNVHARAMVSARLHPLRSIDRLRQAVKLGACFDSSVALLNHLLRDQGDVLVHIVRETTLKVDRVEDGMLSERLAPQRAALGQLRRVLVRLQRLLVPEPAALFRLLRQPPEWVTEDDVDELRQSTEEFALVIQDLQALQERIKLLQEEMAAQIGEQTNRSVFTLTVVTVLALPINIIAGLLGMNVGGIPLAQDEHGFLKIGLIVATFTLVAFWYAFYRKK